MTTMTGVAEENCATVLSRAIGGDEAAFAVWVPLVDRSTGTPRLVLAHLTAPGSAVTYDGGELASAGGTAFLQALAPDDSVIAAAYWMGDGRGPSQLIFTTGQVATAHAGWAAGSSVRRTLPIGLQVAHLRPLQRSLRGTSN